MAGGGKYVGFLHKGRRSVLLKEPYCALCELTGLWFATEGEKRCCSTGSMRKIKSFFNIKAIKLVTVESKNISMNSEHLHKRAPFGHNCVKYHIYYMSLVRRFYPKRHTYSILWAIPTGAIWGEVSCPGTQRQRLQWGLNL